MNLDDIKENYRLFEDDKIKEIALREADKLRPEVLDVLKKEIQKRDLNLSLLKSIDSQTKELSSEEFNEYYQRLRNHHCPVCKSRTKKLSATMVGKVFSILIITNYEKSLKIACSDCLDQIHRKANMKSAIFGWWGIPWGPIHTIRSFIFNQTMKKYNNSDIPNDFFEGVIVENIGIMESAKTEPNNLTELIDRINNAS